MEIPPEIITDILRRLPTKSLGRFKSVSKTWLAQISDPQFIKSHQNTLNRHHLLFNSPNTSLYSLPFNQPEQTPSILSSKSPHDVFIFHGSCNGLVLAFAEDFANFVNFVNTHSLVVFNPTTSEVLKLPESGCEMVNNLLEIDIVYGFGYDSVTDDYKVVTVSYFHYNYLIPPDIMYVHVYSLRNDSWRRVVDSEYDHSHGRSLPGVFVNGFLHWIANKRSGCLSVVVAFSLADERFSEVALPDFGDFGDRVDVLSKTDCRLVGFGGKLGVFLRDEVWLMNEYGVRESWSKISIDGFDNISMVDPKIVYEDGKIMFVSDGLMWIYDVEERCFCKTIDVCRNVKGLKVKGAYVESLVSPKFR